MFPYPEIAPVRRPLPFGDNREVTGTLASIDHRTPYGSLLQRKNVAEGSFCIVCV